MSEDKQKFRVGVSVLTVNKGQMLVGKRKTDGPSNGWWSTPSGGVEWNETLARTGQRELKEETGLFVANRNRFLNVGHAELFRFERHYFMFYFTVELTDEEAARITNAEPDKCEGWSWYNLDDVRMGVLTPFTEPLDIIEKVRMIVSTRKAIFPNV